MADNYYKFSELIDDLTPEACEWVESVLRYPESSDDVQALAALLNREADNAFIEEMDSWPDFEWRIDGCGIGPDMTHTLHLYSEESFNGLHVKWLVQELIQRFMPDYIFSMTNSASCSKPRIGEFGGGWMVVSKDTIEGGNTWGAAEDCVERLTKRMDKAEPLDVHDVLARLRDVGTDSEAAVVTQLAIVAGYLWRCEDCGWISPDEDATCPQCGGQSGG